MSSDKIRLNYPAMQEMAQQCNTTAQRLMETSRLAQQIAQEMQSSAMVGNSGDSFSSALTNAFIPAVNKLSQKFAEEASDIQKAIQDMQVQDTQAAGKFN